MNLHIDRTGWERVALGDVVVASKEKVDPTDGSVSRYVAGEHMVTDDLSIGTWGTIGDGYLGPAFHRRFHPGQVLYGSRRTYLRKVALADFSGVCSNTTFVLQSKDDQRLHPDFLPWVMTSEVFHAFAISESKGSVNPYVNWSDVARYQFALPPLAEQQRLSDLLATTEGRNRALVNLGKALDFASSERATRAIQEAQGREVCLSDTLTIVRGGSPRPIEDYFTKSPDGWNWIKIGDVPPDGKYITETAQKIRREGLSKTRSVASGDLLLSNSMSFGRPYIVRIDGCVHDGWLVLADSHGNWDTEFLYYLLRSPAVQQQFAALAGGSTVKNLNKELVGKVRVRLPELATQRRLASSFSDWDSVVAHVMQEKDALRALRHSILTVIFSSESWDLEQGD